VEESCPAVLDPAAKRRRGVVGARGTPRYWDSLVLCFPLPLSAFRISNLRQESSISPQCPRSYLYLIDFKELSGASQLRVRADAAQKPMSLIRQAEKAGHGKLQAPQNESNQSFPKWNGLESAVPLAFLEMASGTDAAQPDGRNYLSGSSAGPPDQSAGYSGSETALKCGRPALAVR